MPPSNVECIPFPVCCEPVYGYSYADTEFFNSRITGSCPTGYLGGPFVIEAAQFASDISQSDADNQAETFLTSLIAGGCLLNIPVVSNGDISVVVETPISYQILATHSPTSYDATSLPAGLSINHTTGIISGTISSSSITNYDIPISATNGSGTGSGLLTIRVKNGITINPINVSNVSPGNSTQEISVDGTPYVLVTSSGQSFYATSQIKMRSTLLAPLNSPCSPGVGFADNYYLTPTVSVVTLLAGSQLAAVGNGAPITPPGTGVAFVSSGIIGGTGGPQTNNETGPFSRVTSLAGGTLITGSTPSIYHIAENNAGPGNSQFVSVVFETTLNF